MPTTKGVSLKKRIEILQKVAQDFGQRSFCLKPDLSKAQTNDANTNMRIRFDVDEITLYSNDDLTFYNWADVSQDGVFLVLSPEIRINLTNWLVVSDGQEYISVRIEDENKEQVFHAIKDSPFWNKTVTCLSEDRKQVAEVMVDKQGLHINGVLYDVQYYINRNGCGIKSRLGFGLSSQNLGILKGESKFGGDYVPADGVSQAEYDSQLKKYEKALNSFDKKKSFWHKKSLKQEQLYPDLQGTYHVWDFVRIIEDQALQGKTQLTSVILPELLESIGRSAFEDCSNLSTINLPSSLEYIGPSAFRGCSRLKSVSIPKGIKSIKSKTFCYCSSLSSITLPEGLTDIEEEAFAHCYSLESIVLPSSIKRIGKGAFKGCSKLKSIILPNGLSEVGNYVFNNCSGLTSIVIPNSVTKIGKSAFSFCSGLTKLDIPNNVTEISDWCFSGCRGLTNIVIPNRVTKIGEHAFDYCSCLSNINLPRSVTEIGEYAFCECSFLIDIVIPDSIIKIGRGAFWGCRFPENLKSNIISMFGEEVFSPYDLLASLKEEERKMKGKTTAE